MGLLLGLAGPPWCHAGHTVPFRAASLLGSCVCAGVQREPTQRVGELLTPEPHPEMLCGRGQESLG